MQVTSDMGLPDAQQALTDLQKTARLREYYTADLIRLFSGQHSGQDTAQICQDGQPLLVGSGKGPIVMSYLQVSLDLAPPDAQQALAELQRAAPETLAATLEAPAARGRGQDTAQDQEIGQGWSSSQSAGAARQRPKYETLRPITAETSTEHFARMEAFAKQTASALGKPSCTLAQCCDYMT